MAPPGAIAVLEQPVRNAHVKARGDRATPRCIIADSLMHRGFRLNFFPRQILAAALCIATTAAAADLPRDVLAKNRWMELTRADYDRALLKLPENLRFEFAASPKRVQGLLNNMLVTKTLAAQARVHGARPSAAMLTKAGPEDPDRAFAAAEVQRIENDAARAFDEQRPAYEMKAREVYALEGNRFRAPEEVRISDIAVAIKE